MATFVLGKEETGSCERGLATLPQPISRVRSPRPILSLLSIQASSSQQTITGAVQNQSAGKSWAFRGGVSSIIGVIALPHRKLFRRFFSGFFNFRGGSSWLVRNSNREIFFGRLPYYTKSSIITTSKHSNFHFQKTVL